MTDIQKRAVGYVRVSTTAQVQEGESLETQKTAIATYYNQHNLELVETFLDEGISGRKQDRPGLIALLDGAKQRKFDYVIVTRLTRFGALPGTSWATWESWMTTASVSFR